MTVNQRIMVRVHVLPQLITNASMGRKELIEELRKLAEPALAKDPKDRTYRDRYCIWEYEHYKKDKHEFLDEGEEVEIYDGTALANNKIKDGFGKDFPEWFRECGKHFGQQVKVKITGQVLVLIGMSYTYRDYYYILEKDGKRTYETCVSGIEFLG